MRSRSTSATCAPTVGADGQTIELWPTGPVDDDPDAPKPAPVGYISAPVMIDALEAAAPPETVSVELFQPGLDAEAPAGATSAAIASLGPTEVAVVYTIDPAWLADPGRQFPVVLDPDACIGAGAGGCAINRSSGVFDHFVMSGYPTQYPTGWTVLRVGRVSADYDRMRSLLYFPSVTLPDGAVVHDTNLRMHVSSLLGGASGETINAYLINQDWGQTTTWNQFDSGGAYDSSPVVTSTVPASGNMNFDVDALVQSWYTRRAKDWEPNFGILLKMASETDANGVAQFDRYNDGTSSFRPLLVIHYDVPKVSIDFDPALGANYAPSTMVAGQPTVVPLRVTNDGSGFDFAGPDWLIGYRWLDAKGKVVGTPSQAAMPCVGSGTGCANPSAVFGLTVTPPSTIGQYTLRLDLVRNGTVDQYASDWATPSLYYARRKKVLSKDNSRWTGKSVVERDEFSINVTSGSSGGEVKTVTTGTGGALGINLSSKDLSYVDDTGLGFSDLIPVGLTYGHHSADATSCSSYQGILGACGWFANWDERITGGPNATGYDYVYQAPSGERYLMDTDPGGQLVGGAPVLINRPRFTYVNENEAPGPNVTRSSTHAYTGTYSNAAASNLSAGLGIASKVNLNAYRYARFAMRTANGGGAGAASSGLCFEIDNVSDSEFANRWFCYTVGTNWSTGFDQQSLGNPSGGSLATSWQTYSDDLFSRVSNNGAFGGLKDDYQVVDVQIRSAGSSAGSTYLDDLRLEAVESGILDETNRSWSSASGSVTSWSPPTGDYTPRGSVGWKITSSPLASSPDCNTTQPATPCWSTSGGALWTHGFVHWQWRKTGGSTAAMVFYLRNERTLATGTITYYAGPSAPTGAINPIQVSPTVPTDWTLVRRNLLEDARTVLDYYDDAGSGEPDDVRMRGFKMSGVDGNHLLVDDFYYGTLADIGAVDPTGLASPVARPSGPADTTYVYDFSADYPDGSRHYFNRAGLLERIRDADGNQLRLDWEVGAAADQSAYRLTAIRAPSDETSASGHTFQRRIELPAPAPSGNFQVIRFQERLGRDGVDDSAREAVFYVATTANNVANDKYGVGDLVRVSHPRDGDHTCGDANPNGCVEFSYTTSTGEHRLQFVGDPRWAGATSGSGDYRWEIGRDGTNAPISIKDRSHSGSELLVVRSYNAAGSTYRRALWQDAASRAGGGLIRADLTPDGSVLYGYMPRPCGSGDCSIQGNWPVYSDQHRVLANEYDGLARVSTVRRYRCPGQSLPGDGCDGLGARVSISRQGTFAQAKVDNYSDPLAAGQLAWTQDDDQFFASLRDSGGADPDLYRTTYRYDGHNRVSDTVRPVWNRAPSYTDSIARSELFGYLKGYWRLDETSGSAAADASGNGFNGTYTGPTLGGTGALFRESPNKAPTFDGTNDYVGIASSLGTVSGSFTVSAWIRPSVLPDATNTARAFIGSRKGTTGSQEFSFDAKLVYQASDKSQNLQVNIGNGTAWLYNGSNWPYPFVANRWYHVVVAVDDAKDTATAFVNGVQIGSSGFITAGTPRLADSTRVLKIGNNGRDSSTPQWFAGSIDEVAAYTTALPAPYAQRQYEAGRGIALVNDQATRDREGHVTQVTDNALVNPGFEQALDGWHLHNAPTPTASAGAARSGGFGLSTGTNGAAVQVLQFVPGQRVHFQFDARTDGTAGAHATWLIQYWSKSAAAWQNLSWTYLTSASWQTKAYQFVLPHDSDGRALIQLYNDAWTGAAHFDDVLVSTTFGRTAYAGTAGGLGLPTDSYTFMSCSSGSACSGELRSNLGYAVPSGGQHPAIFPTSAIANYVGGTQGASTTDDLTTLTAYDAWGRPLTVTDPDGVGTSGIPDDFTQTTVYATNQTDVASQHDALGNTTAYLYDAVGNTTQVTSATGALTETEHDLLNHAVEVVAPDLVVARNDFNTYGQLVASWADYRNGTSGDQGGTDDVVTKTTYDVFGYASRLDADCSATSGVITCPGSGLDARTDTTHDVLGTAVSTTAYTGSGGTGSARTATQHFETYTPPGSTPYAGITFSRLEPSGSQLPIAPAGSPAPLCPGSASVRCNSAAVNANGTPSTAIDGSPTAVTDAYGIVTLADRDLAGRPVRTIANYQAGGGHGTNNDRNVETRYDLDIFGRVKRETRVDAGGSGVDRFTATVHDALGRPIETSIGTGGTTLSSAKTVYRASGRVDRVSSTETSTASDAQRTWTRSLYDAAGRATTTLDHYDTTGAARMSLAGFETADATWFEAGKAGWSVAATGFFTGSAATMSLDLDEDGELDDPVRPSTGNGRLRVSTAASTTNSGISWDLSNSPVTQTFKAGRTYKVRFDLRGPASGSLRAFFGKDASGGSYVEVDGDQNPGNGTQPISTDGAWHSYAATWTVPAGSDLTSGVRFAVRKDTAGSVDFHLDNVTVWDETDAASVAWNVPTDTALDGDGRVVTSQLPPGAPATERPMATRTGYDPMGRVTQVAVNFSAGATAGLTYADTVNTTPGRVAFWRLGESSGSTAFDQAGVANGTYTGSHTKGVAGATGDGNTAVTLSGGFVSVPDSAAVDVGNGPFTIEAWVKRGSTGTEQTIIGKDSFSYYLFFAANNKVVLAKADTADIVASTTTITDSTWHHVVAVYEKDVTAKLYIDGADVSGAVSYQNLIDNSTQLGLGSKHGAWANAPFSGSLDEVALYKAALGPSTVAAHYAARSVATSDTTTNLTTATAYDALGRAVSSTDPTGTVTRYDYDRLGRPVAATLNYLNGTSSGASADDDVRSTFGYNALGELTDVCPPRVGAATCTSANSAAWHYAFDALGRQTRQIAPVNTTVTDLDTFEWVYEAGGRLDKTCEYPAGGSCTSTANTRFSDSGYDDLGRVLTEQVKERFTGSDVTRLAWTNAYNLDGTQASVSFDGTGSSPSQGTDALTFTYDTHGRPDQIKDGATVLTDFGWNADGTLASRVDGTVGTSSFAYDWANRLTSQTPPAAFSGSNISQTWRLDGTLATKSWPGSLTMTAAYDAAKRPTKLDFGTPGWLEQAYDRDGNVAWEERSLTVAGGSGDAISGRQTFAYDGLNRLVASTGLVSGARSYTYDLDSNRLTKTEAGTTYSATYDATGALAQVWKAGQGVPQLATHDAFGNLLANPETGVAAPTFAYDAANRLTGIDAAGSTNDTSFGFDALGRHVSRTINGTTETYEFLGVTETVTKIDAATDILSLVDDSGARQATLTGSTVAWLMPDPHGNVAGQAQASALTTALRYDGYGLTVASAPTSLPDAARRWKYQGRLDIAPDGLAAPLYEFSARFYSPGLGTFTQLDTLQGQALDPLSLNRYLYAAANPATLIDPTGLFSAEADDGPGTHCKNRGDPDCGETVVANPGAGGGWQSSTGAVYSRYTGNTNSNNVNPQSTAAGNTTSGGGVPPTSYHWVHDVLVDSNGIPFSETSALQLMTLCSMGTGSGVPDVDAACEGFRKFYAQQEKDRAAFCSDYQAVCDAEFEQSALTVLLVTEIAATLASEGAIAPLTAPGMAGVAARLAQLKATTSWALGAAQRFVSRFGKPSGLWDRKPLGMDGYGAWHERMFFQATGRDRSLPWPQKTIDDFHNGNAISLAATRPTKVGYGRYLNQKLRALASYPGQVAGSGQQAIDPAKIRQRTLIVAVDPRMITREIEMIFYDAHLRAQNMGVTLQIVGVP